MALTLAILPTGSSTSMVAGQSCTFIAAVTNAGATSVTLASLSVASSDGRGSFSIAQPDFLVPNMPVGLGNPILLPSTTYNYPFRVVYLSPNTPGPSPQAPGGAQFSPSMPTDTDFGIQLQSVSSDGTVASTVTTDPVLTSVSPYPVPLGGAIQLNSGANLVNFLTTFA